MRREIIGILRGVTPPESANVAETLIENGITMIEVPLNSPHPFDSIAAIVEIAGERALVGAGTVLTVQDVHRLAGVGARMVVSPDCNPAVIEASKCSGLLSYPGVTTPSECFRALRAGATGLKLFPASLVGPSGLKALRAVLPQDTAVYAVGGAAPESFADWITAGVTGFGIGSGLFVPGMGLESISTRARAIVAAYDAVCSIR